MSARTWAAALPDEVPAGLDAVGEADAEGDVRGGDEDDPDDGDEADDDEPDGDEEDGADDGLPVTGCPGRPRAGADLGCADGGTEALGGAKPNGWPAHGLPVPAGTVWPPDPMAPPRAADAADPPVPAAEPQEADGERAEVVPEAVGAAGAESRTR
jgi:hypothetical protein